MSKRSKTANRSPLRARLCSIENANRLAVMVADEAASDTVVVRTGNPVQPFRVILANCASEQDIVSRTLSCSADGQTAKQKADEDPVSVGALLNQ